LPFSITTLEEGRFLEVNAAFEARYSRQEIRGRTAHELRIWDDPADRRLLVTQLQRGGPMRNVITRPRAKTGKIRLTVYPPSASNSTGKSAYSRSPKMW